MTIEWTITFGQIAASTLTLLGFVAAAFGFFLALRKSIDLTTERMGVLAGRMINVEAELKQLAKVMTNQAVQDQKILSLDQRLDRIQGSTEEWRLWVGQRISELERPQS